jgi:hypothetical protein
MSSTTSPHVFKDMVQEDTSFIEGELEKNEYCIFIRKVAPEFPDEILDHYIYEYNKEKDDLLIIDRVNQRKNIIRDVFYIVGVLFCLYHLYYWAADIVCITLH